MSMFRRPTDDSDSDSDDSEEEPHVQSIERSEGSLEADLTRTETLSSGESISVSDQDETNIVNVEHHRNMMLASLLEDFYRTRAAELLNAACPGSTYHRQSPEIQSVARNLFEQASQTLVAGGILPSSVASDNVRIDRNKYLTGFGNLGLQNLQDSDLLPDAFRRRLSAGENFALVRANGRASTVNSGPTETPMRGLAMQINNVNLMTNSFNGISLTDSQPARSHYQSSFREMSLLGKGGFGRVYHTYNLFDKKEYAIKKIPLSPKLSQRYRENGHTELNSVLREVQALARLDHCNVVRYHATWIEEPSSTLIAPQLSRAQYGQRLLANQPAFPSGANRTSTQEVSQVSDGIMFEPDNADEIRFSEPEWSLRPPESHLTMSSLPADSDIFTDGVARKMSRDTNVNDPSCYVLHVQMSMYPMTLAQYMAPIPEGTVSNPGSPNYRHCFHLIPTLRIILGILCGLQYIHVQGMIHRDIKPGNIFISSHDAVSHAILPEGFQNVGNCQSCPQQSVHHVNPRIGDFGLVAELARNAAEARDGSSDSSDTAVGTEYYRPPPVDNGKGKQYVRIDEKLDVFALGVILVELLCYCSTSMERLGILKGLQSGETPSYLKQAIEAEGYESAISESVNDCIRHMIDKDAGQRWSCSQIKDHVESVLNACKAGKMQTNACVKDLHSQSSTI